MFSVGSGCDMSVAGESSRARLLATATRLFAERGLDGVSLREIIREAGIKHATAIQYHYRDREGLLAAIMAPHEAAVGTRRDAMLDVYEGDAVPDCRAVAAIMVRPLARELESADGKYFLRIYAQWIQHERGLYEDTGTSMWRWRRAADHFLSFGTADFHPRCSALIFTIVELARRATGRPHDDDRLFISRVIDIVAGILQAPLSAETERLDGERRAREHLDPDDRDLVI
jgi:AcrR family transcriptional regulator